MRFNIKTVSEANQREHWAKKNRRKNDQQLQFLAEWRKQAKDKEFTFPMTVIFTRYSCQKMDSDNLAGAFKGVRDQLAKILNIDDGSELIKFEYKQKRIPKREYYFTVEINSDCLKCSYIGRTVYKYCEDCLSQLVAMEI